MYTTALAQHTTHTPTPAELAVKVGKKLLRENTRPWDSPDTNRFMRAIMQFRNI